VLELYHRYGVDKLLGFRFGYEGLSASRGVEPWLLTPELVRDIHRVGGSVLGTGRGSPDVGEMVDRLSALELDILIAIGGDGTLRGAHAISTEAAKRGRALAVVGVPKTIDNDIPFVDQTFGFDTAVQIAAQALKAAHTEATSARHGIGLVKLMGREAGFICAHAALASLDVNFCLVPEVPFELEGASGLLAALEARVLERGHALIAVAEGCGLALANAHGERDASGNLRFASQELDIGGPLRAEIQRHFKTRQVPITLKYIDPSYLIRSVPANASDTRYCDLLARHAVHAAMAGKTDLSIGHWNGCFTHVPLASISSRRKRVDPHGELWFSVTSATGQPPLRSAMWDPAACE
jgi:6-phosphofructokinase 1